MCLSHFAISDDTVYLPTSSRDESGRAADALYQVFLNYSQPVEHLFTDRGDKIYCTCAGTYRVHKFSWHQ